MTTALILVDIQNDYFPGGKMELDQSVQASEHARHLLEFFRERRLPLVHIQHVATRSNAAFFLPNTEGVDHQQNAKPLPGETVLQKHFPNAFRETPLLDYLRSLQITRVVIAGMMTHMCVDATVRAATDLGFQCVTAEDACATRGLTHAGQTVPAEFVQRSFLAALNGSYGEVLKTADILAQLDPS